MQMVETLSENQKVSAAGREGRSEKRVKKNRGEIWRMPEPGRKKK
jgi:hypothetical protein